MDDANRASFAQVLYNMRLRMLNTNDHVQPGARPEQHTYSPIPYPSDARVFSPAPPLSNVQSQASALADQPTHQASAVFPPDRVISSNATTTPQSIASPSTSQHTHQASMALFANGFISHNVTPAPRLGMPRAQHVHRPVQQQQQQQLGSRPSVQPFSNNNINQIVNQPNQMRHGAPHRQSGHTYHARHHPYEAPPSHAHQGPPESCSQSTPEAPLPKDATYPPSRFDGPTAMPQVRTAADQNEVYRRHCEAKLHEQQRQTQPQTVSLPRDVMYSPRGPAPAQILQPSQSKSAGRLPLSKPYDQNPAQSYGRITQLTQSTPQAPLSSVSTPVHHAHSRPDTESLDISHITAKPVVQSMSQTPRSTVSTPVHSARPPAQPSSAPPPRNWNPQLQTAAYGPLSLQAQPETEVNHPDQKELVDAMKERSPGTLRPHEFMDYLTMEHNARVEGPFHRVYDMLFMQTLLFAKDEVLLTSPKNVQPFRWEPPQSVVHASDMSGYSPHYCIMFHMFKALNTASDLLPNEIMVCADHHRHESPVNVIKTNGKPIYGWSLTMSCEINPRFSGLRPRNCYSDQVACFFDENNVKRLNMDPVWKAKVLAIFELRRKAKNAKREDFSMAR